MNSSDVNHSKHPMLKPEITVFTGPMYSGKSSAVISKLERYNYAEIKALLFKPAKDNRYSDTEVVNHNGALRYKSINIQNPEEIFNYISPEEKVAIGIDEAMMLPSSILRVCETLRALGNPVFVSTLDMDSNGNPFVFSDYDINGKTIGDLFAIADQIKKFSSVCTYKENGTTCGSVARYTTYIGETPKTEILKVGGTSEFQPSCIKHHPVVSCKFNGFI